MTKKLLDSVIEFYVWKMDELQQIVEKIETGGKVTMVTGRASSKGYTIR